MKTKKLVCYNCGGHGFITSTYENGQTSAICPVCGGIGSHEIQMTNADRIRSMSDEELTKMLWKAGRNYRSICADPVVDYNEHYEHLIEWLQQPAEEDDHDERKENENV